MPKSSQPADLSRMSDKLVPPDTNRPGLQHDDMDGMSQPGDVDKMVSSFLLELNTLSDALGLAQDNPAEDIRGVLNPTDLPRPAATGPSASLQEESIKSSAAAQAATLKSAPYRNIDVLFMDDLQVTEGRERTQEEISLTIDGLYDSQSPRFSPNTRRRRIRALGRELLHHLLHRKTRTSEILRLSRHP